MENKLLSVVGMQQPRGACREDFLCSWCLGWCACGGPTLEEEREWHVGVE